MSDLEEQFHNQLRYAGLDDGLVREFPFAKVMRRRFRLDFAWPERQIGVELQGGVYAYAPSHTSIRRMREDRDKANHVALLGWRVFMFDAKDVDDGTALDWVEKALREEHTA
jgi:very-short-patch-repair endonuclease